MRKVRNAIKNRVLVTLFAVTMIWFSLATAFASNASTQDCLYQSEVFFYTDVNKNELCGYWNACTSEAWGCITQYRKTNLLPCPCD
jgi:hypothetical protein